MTDIFNKFYTAEVLKHVRSPRNMGEMKNPDGVAIIGNPVCGDIMKFYIKVGTDRKEKYIKDIKFQTLGCGAAIATSSMMTVMAKGKSLSKVKKITKEVLVKALGGLPPTKTHCSVLAGKALKKAISNYKANEFKK